MPSIGDEAIKEGAGVVILLFDKAIRIISIVIGDSSRVGDC